MEVKVRNKIFLNEKLQQIILLKSEPKISNLFLDYFDFKMQFLNIKLDRRNHK